MGLKSHSAFDTFDTNINFSHKVDNSYTRTTYYVCVYMSVHTHTHPFTEEHSINSDCSARLQVFS